MSLNYGFCKKSLRKDELQVPQSEEKSVQLVRRSSLRSDFLQNPYFRDKLGLLLCPYNKKGSTLEAFSSRPRAYATNDNSNHQNATKLLSIDSRNTFKNTFNAEMMVNDTN